MTINGLTQTRISANKIRSHFLCVKSVLLVIVLCFKGEVLSQDDWESPCPRLFVYEIVDRKGSWDGIFNLVSQKSLGGVWFRLEFDRAVSRFETTFGESVEAKNESLFVIKAPNTALPAHMTISVPFSVTFDEYRAPPRLQAAYLNFVKICPEKEEVPLTTPMKHVAFGVTNPGGPVTTSPRRPDPVFTSPPYTEPPKWSRRTTAQRPELTTNKAIQELSILGTEDDDDLFIGDFQFLQSQEATELVQQCGTVAVKPTPLISYGQPSTAGEFPWHVALYQLSNYRYICGGSLISDYFVVTAGHCVAKARKSIAAKPEKFYVQLGKYYYNVLRSSPNIQDSMVSEVILHHEYNHVNYRNDIALLKLVKPAVLTDFVRAICLWDGDNDLRYVENEIGTICGWGLNEVQKNVDDLKKASMLVASERKCRSANANLDKYLGPKSYCAGFRNGTSACSGDSGGGMVFPKRQDPQRWTLRGLVSLSLSLQYQRYCDINNYVIFTDVAKYTNWIRDNMRPRHR